MPIGGGGGGGASSASALGFVGCKAFNSAVQTINSGASTAVTFDSEEYDTSAFHSTSANTSRMTVPTGLAGYYLCVFSTFYNASPSNIHLGFTKNGTTALRLAGGSSIAAASYSPEAITVVNLAVADFVEVFVLQSTGGGVGIGHATVLDAQSTFAFTLLGV